MKSLFVFYEFSSFIHYPNIWDPDIAQSENQG